MTERVDRRDQADSVTAEVGLGEVSVVSALVMEFTEPSAVPGGGADGGQTR